MHVNNLQAILRNFVDFFALSAVRFSLYTKVMPPELLADDKLRIKIVMNLCHFCNKKIGSQLKNEVHQYFYSTFDLFKYMCLRTYSKLLGKYKVVGNFKFLKLVDNYLSHMDLERCLLRSNQKVYAKQINQMIDQQVVKFLVCKVD